MVAQNVDSTRLASRFALGRLLAFAGLGAMLASAPAAAQSTNVTLYGIADLGMQWNDIRGQPGTFSVVSGHHSGSRMGFRGTEELTGGTAAIFAVEAGINMDTGGSNLSSAQTGGVPPASGTFTPATVTRFFSRQSWVGLRGDWGQFVMGRFGVFSSGTGSIDFSTSIDPFTTGWGISTMGSTFGSMGPTLRADNNIAYTSPTMAGLRGGIAYSANISGDEFPGNANNLRLVALGSSYTNGPLYAVLTYDIFLYGEGPHQTHLQTGATYDLVFIKLHAAYGHYEHVRQFATPVAPVQLAGPAPRFPGQGADYDSYMVGVTWPLFGGFLLADYQEKVAKRYQLTATTFFDPDRKVYSLGYWYPLSKRTNLYAAAAKSEGGGSLAGTATDQKQYTIGIRHLY